MIDGELKSPCHECVIHLRGLDKRDTRYPCITCVKRLAYVAQYAAGVPVEPVEDNIYRVSTESISILELLYAN